MKQLLIVNFSGVSYVIDKISKNCTIQSLKNTTYDSAFDHRRILSLRLKSPLELFYLDDSYIYKGKVCLYF